VVLCSGEVGRVAHGERTECRFALERPAELQVRPREVGMMRLTNSADAARASSAENAGAVVLSSDRACMWAHDGAF